MRKRTVRITPKALEDLAGIEDYLLSGDPANADRVMAWAFRCIEELEETATIHAVLDHGGVPPDVRFTLIHTYSEAGVKRSATTRWIVFYRVLAKTVEILRVRHTSQRPLWED